LFSLIPLLRTIPAGFIILFSYMSTKYIHYIYPSSPFPYIFPPPPGAHSYKGPVFLSVLYFFLICVDSSREFCLGISDIYILYFNQINLEGRFLNTLGLSFPICKCYLKSFLGLIVCNWKIILLSCFFCKTGLPFYCSVLFILKIKFRVELIRGTYSWRLGLPLRSEYQSSFSRD
jgi:hypothetical protein